MATSITQFTITVSFDDDYTVGQYVNGDYYIVAPSGVSITGGTLATGSRNMGATAGRDGISVNPSAGSQGFDDRGPGYNSSLNKALSLPFTASPGDSVIFSESADSGLTGGVDRIKNLHDVYLETAIVLTVVASAPAANSFRPQFCAGTKTTYAWADVDTGDLPGLTTVTGAPSFSDASATIERMQLDYGFGSSWNPMRPYQQMSNYSFDNAKVWGTSLLASLIDPTGDTANHDTLVQRLIQFGIDLYGMLLSGTRWNEGGGHPYGRLAPIKYAGYLLGVAAMRDLSYSTSFGECAFTFYVGAANCPPYTNPDDLGEAEWTINGVNYNTSLSSPYRWVGSSFIAPALTMAALGLDETLVHDAFFDYTERYQTDIASQGGNFTTPVFHDNMYDSYWATYWTTPSPAPRLIMRAQPR